jgi:hypothetical protein
MEAKGSLVRIAQNRDMKVCPTTWIKQKKSMKNSPAGSSYNLSTVAL